MRKLKQIVIALLTACIMTALCFAGAWSVNAAEVVVPGSAFTYDVITKKVTHNGQANCLELTIRFLNNPGVNLAGLMIEADSECTFTGELAGDTGHVLDWRYSNNSDYNRAIIQYFPGINAPKDNYEFIVYLHMNDPSNLHQIQVYLVALVCKSENPHGVTGLNKDNSGTEIEVGSPAEAMLGDADADNRITSIDAYLVQGACNYYGERTIAYLNSQKSTAKFKELLPNLEYAEIIDVNFDHKVNATDYTNILTYSSQAALGTADPDDAIGKIFYINV